MERSPALDPEIADLLSAPDCPLPPPIESHAEIAQIRQRPMFDAELSDAVERTDVSLPCTPEVRVRVHRPRDVPGRLPCVVSIHGGGYVFGSFGDDDLRHDRWCPKLGYIGVSVDYRLAPEHPYPLPLEDCFAAFTWVHENASGLDVDRTCVGVAGFSAGGGLAAALGLLARDRGAPPVAFQQLIAPMLDDRPRTASSRLDPPVWNRRSNALGWSCYLGELEDGIVPEYAAPARATDLTRLSPTFLGVGTVDLFRDENIDFGQRLMQAGVDVELHVYPGAPHAFDVFAGRAQLATRAVRDQRAWLEARLAVRAGTG